MCLLVNDAPAFQIAAGGLLEAVPYRLAPGKITILRRLCDGFEPHINE